MNLTRTAREIFTESLSGLDIPAAVRHLVKPSPGGVVIDGRELPVANFRRVILISIGKAAAPMANSLLSQLRPALTPAQTMEGIVVAPSLPEMLDNRMQFFRGSHPLPDQVSEIAANAILWLLKGCDADCLVFFLISGGASAMVEQPLDPALSLADAIDLNRALIRSGLPIAKMNVLRKHFSRVKGGRLAVAAGEATQCTLLISDVPSDALHVIGSGPSLPDPSTIADCRHIIDSTPSLHLSDSLLKFFRGASLEETPKLDHPAFGRAHAAVLLSSDSLLVLAAQAATSRGFHVAVDTTCDECDYREAAHYLLHRLEVLRRQHPRVCLLSAGELSVEITGTPGTGGRNQQFVLECARLLAERNLTATVLSAGSDGIDGNSTAAGAVCDETTFARAEVLGIDVLEVLGNFNSALVFIALGDAIVTAPTGNNVRDLRILLSATWHSPSPSAP